MSNQLLNKLKIIDNSRQRLEDILTEKKMSTPSNSLPNLVETVMNLYPKDYVDIGWNGVPEEPMPEHYTPAVDFMSIYEADTDKDDYTNVAMYILDVDAGLPATLRAGSISGFQYYKYSDTEILTSASGYDNTSHTWDTSKDIVIDGKKYRWIMCYGNTNDISADYNGNYLNVDALIYFKGTYTWIGWRDNSNAPAYTEIMEGCTLIDNGTNLASGGIVCADTDIDCPNPKTFICNASQAFLEDRLFRRCVNLKVVKMTSKCLTQININHMLFYGCTSLRYIYLKEAHKLSNSTFNLVNNCYIQIDNVIDSVFNYDDAFGEGPFGGTTNLRVRIGTMNSTGWLVGFRSRMAHKRIGNRNRYDKW